MFDFISSSSSLLAGNPDLRSSLQPYLEFVYRVLRTYVCIYTCDIYAPTTSVLFCFKPPLSITAALAPRIFHIQHTYGAPPTGSLGTLGTVLLIISGYEGLEQNAIF